jgi:hypothetical protein
MSNGHSEQFVAGLAYRRPRSPGADLPRVARVTHIDFNRID